MQTDKYIECAGCGLRMPPNSRPVTIGYYNTSPECWLVYTEVLAAEYGNAVLFGAVHQLTVDTYAVQHAGGPHPDKSVDVHLAGLHLVLERGIRPPYVAPHLQRLASSVTTWPHFPPPRRVESVTVCDVALAGSIEGHISVVERWSRTVWEAWSQHHAAVADFVAHCLPVI